ncbi:helix-turn-helix domain-containing protein [Streptomyces sp. NPDC012693]|uniref:helix-turn-helix domain-containing protein n=1 Tax=Streptomyces sp. NPDC012693 TaxID=3364844 RepID=UPI0036C80C25
MELSVRQLTLAQSSEALCIHRSSHVSFDETSILEGLIMEGSDSFQRVDALLERLDEAPILPPPRVRAQLRLAAGLTQQNIADALGVKRMAVTRWELGQTSPRRPHRDAYIRLLNGLAERFPEAAEPDEGMPTPTSRGGSG